MTERGEKKYRKVVSVLVLEILKREPHSLKRDRAAG